MNNSDPVETGGTATDPGEAPAVTEGRRSRKGCFFVWCGLIGVGLVVLFSVAPPQIMSMRSKGDQVVAMNNGKRLVLALNDFAAEYGSFPSHETVKALRESPDTAIDKTTLELDGDTANHYFRQLIAAGVVKSEDPFFAKTPYSRYGPDGNMKGSLALQAGEVGFGYLMNGDKAMPADDPNRVIAVTPLLNATAPAMRTLYGSESQSCKTLVNFRAFPLSILQKSTPRPDRRRCTNGRNRRESTTNWRSSWSSMNTSSKLSRSCGVTRSVLTTSSSWYLMAATVSAEAGSASNRKSCQR